MNRAAKESGWTASRWAGAALATLTIVLVALVAWLAAMGPDAVLLGPLVTAAVVEPAVIIRSTDSLTFHAHEVVWAVRSDIACGNTEAIAECSKADAIDGPFWALIVAV